MPLSKTTQGEQSNDFPPIFKSWDQMYIFVLVLHAIIIALFYLFTKTYS